MLPFRFVLSRCGCLHARLLRARVENRVKLECARSRHAEQCAGRAQDNTESGIQKLRVGIPISFSCIFLMHVHSVICFDPAVTQ